jgi:hypothetical protein
MIFFFNPVMNALSNCQQNQLMWNINTQLHAFISRHIGFLLAFSKRLILSTQWKLLQLYSPLFLLLIFLGVTLLWKPSPCLKTLGGKHVLITGGSSGIGLAIAKEALSQGAFVTLIARSSAKLEKAIDKLVDNKTISADRISTKVHVYVFLIVSFIIGVRYLLG